jgi:hypothetical protein
MEFDVPDQVGLHMLAMQIKPAQQDPCTLTPVQAIVAVPQGGGDGGVEATHMPIKMKL